jgi:antitoxin (DNA-binding transcriptional repressor) of toxin-antitoxin stability system
MKTISLRELHHKTGQWVRRVREEGEIIVTDRGQAIASLHRFRPAPSKKVSWKNRPLTPGYAACLKAGKLKTRTDSTSGISDDRSSRDNVAAGDRG